VAATAVLAACAHQNAAQPTAQPKPALAWYRLPGGEYSVLMPPGVTTKEQTGTVANGEQMKIHIVESTPPGTGESYLVSYTELPHDVLASVRPSDLLDGVQAGTLKQVNAQLINSKDINAAGMQGREFQARKSGQGNMLARVLVGNAGVFTLIGTYEAPQPPQNVLRFLSSLTAGRQAVSAEGQPGAQGAQPPPGR
jgi:hypothetical protein